MTELVTSREAGEKVEYFLLDQILSRELSPKKGHVGGGEKPR